MSRDPLSDLLRCVRLRGALFFHVQCSGPWVSEAPPSAEIRPLLMPESEHLMEYHLVLKGACWAGVTGEPPVRMHSGDVVVFPHGDRHVMSSLPGMRAEPDVDELLRNVARQPLPFLVQQDAGDDVEDSDAGELAATTTATLLCGFLGCDRGPFNPLLEALPRMIHARAAATSDQRWSAQLGRLAALQAERRRPGGEAVLERMSEMMFVDVVRGYLDGLPDNQTGWLAGLRDRHVGRALSLIHGDPAHPWTLDLLSAHAGLSRSALHERFVQLIRQSPIQYLKNWRMQLATRLLAEGNCKLAAVAREVGYESEAAFSRTFKRTVGVSPTAWRRRTHDADFFGRRLPSTTPTTVPD
ncbi:AraC family transcriptional regulator [Ectothiorhodospiraceae bacterium WFHF3C12]|nr:AraC family transcriptional regulator [Ectothiorhodospiraceae bacterium WFHF3C12]